MGTECSVWLYVREPNELRDWDHTRDWPVRAEGSANVQAVTDVAAFESAIRGVQLAAPDAGNGVVGGVLGGMGRGFGVGGGGPAHEHLVIDVEPGGPWASPPSPKDLAGEQRRFDACPATKTIFDEVLIGVDAHGKVDRCEGREQKCLCDALRGHAFPAGAPLRRARVRFAKSGSASGFGKLGPLNGKAKLDFFVHLHGYGSEFKDDSTAMRAQEKGLEACFAPTASPQRFEADVVMTVDEGGVVKDAHVTKGHDAMSEKELACVTKWAVALKLSCETLGGDPVRVTALVTVMR
jgi:hypothetical protein